MILAYLYKSAACTVWVHGSSAGGDIMNLVCLTNSVNTSLRSHANLWVGVAKSCDQECCDIGEIKLLNLSSDLS